MSKKTNSSTSSVSLKFRFCCSFQTIKSWSVYKNLRTLIGVFLRFSKMTMQKVILFIIKIFYVYKHCGNITVFY